MGRHRRRFSADFKSKVALAAIKGDRTLSELAAQFQVHPHQVMAWKKQALAVLPEVFSRKRDMDESRRSQLSGRTLRSDRSAQGGVGLVEKKSWIGTRCVSERP